MEYKCIYEAVESVESNLFRIPLLIVAIIFLSLFVYTLFNWRNIGIFGNIVSLFALIILSAVLIIPSLDLMESKTIFQRYKSGDFSVVEGVIENYEVGSEQGDNYADTFTVCDEEFVIKDTVYGYVYTYDGRILCDGMNCKIIYIPHKTGNIIMELWVSE